MDIENYLLEDAKQRNKRQKIKLVISENLVRKSRNMVIYRVENGNRYNPVVYLQPAKHLDKRDFDDIVRFLVEYSILREE